LLAWGRRRRSSACFCAAYGAYFTHRGRLVDGFFMFVLQSPERARSLGLLGAKAQSPGATLPGPLLELLCGIVPFSRSGYTRAQRCGWTKPNRSPWSQPVRELP
jgi:hypothetical protein